MCGAVKVHVTALPLLTLACHCRGCQKFSASAFSLTTMFQSESVSFTGPLQKGGLKDPDRVHHFCKSCLNFIYSQIKGAEHRINLRTSVLHDAASFKPFVEVMAEEKMPWAHVPIAHSFSRYPTSLDELQRLMDEFASQDDPHF
jgi:hypothetical protein